ncbi:LysR family transcriptional regulator [Ketogulonicigenium vulgare]|uniref:LysR family transcriptional regulator n=1 Tax=Ketogulonicigenium vulgare TaxID=92945 RepID=UPI00235983F5|nr:LysR family transcriptional regulator [Ketogulonicigenium vulgare]
MLDIRRLRYFKVIAECGSMAAAARQLNIAQPALSGHIAQIEEHYALQLFQRHARGVTLTPAGEALLRHARRILENLSEAEAELRHLSPVTTRAPVRLGLLPSWGASLAPAIIQATQLALPDIALRIVEMRHDESLDAIRQQNIDLAVVLEDTAPAQTQLLGSEALLYVSHVAVADRMSFRDVAALPLILPSAANLLRHQLDKAAKAAHVVLGPVMEIDGQDTIKSAVKAGVAGSIMSWNSIRNECLDHSLSACLIDDPEITRNVYLRRGEHVPASLAEAFFVVLRQVAEDNSYSRLRHPRA